MTVRPAMSFESLAELLGKEPASPSLRNLVVDQLIRTWGYRATRKPICSDVDGLLQESFEIGLELRGRPRAAVCRPEAGTD